MVIDLEHATEQIQDFVAKAQSGEEVIFVRDGQTMARVSPSVHKIIVTEEQRLKALEAIRGMKELSNRLNLGPFDIQELKTDRNFGRR